MGKQRQRAGERGVRVGWAGARRGARTVLTTTSSSSAARGRSAATGALARGGEAVLPPPHHGDSDPDPWRLLSHQGGPAGGWVRDKKPNSSSSCGIGRCEMSGRKGLWGLCAACGVGHGLRSPIEGEEEVDPPHLRALRVDQSVQPLGPAKRENQYASQHSPTAHRQRYKIGGRRCPSQKTDEDGLSRSSSSYRTVP